METKEDEMEHSKPDLNKEDDASQIVCIVDLANGDDDNITKEESTECNNTGFEENKSKDRIDNEHVNNVENDSLPVSNLENTIQKEECGYAGVDTAIINLDNLNKDLDEPNVRASNDIDNNASLEIICVDSDSDSDNIQLDENVSNVQDSNLQESLSKKELSISSVILKEDTTELKTPTVTNEESSDSSITETTPENTKNNPRNSETGIEVNFNKNVTMNETGELEKKKSETMQINKGHGLTKPDVMIHIPMGSYDLSQDSGISSFDIDFPVKEVKAFASDDTVNKVDHIKDYSIIENNSQNISPDNELRMDIDRPDLECVQTDKLDTNVLTNNENILDIDKAKIREEKANEIMEKSELIPPSNISHSVALDNKQNLEINSADFEEDRSISKMNENKQENDMKNLSAESSCNKSNEKAFIQRVNVINIERLMSQKDVTCSANEVNIQDINVGTLNANNISNEDTVIDNNVGHDSIMDNEEKSSNPTEPPTESMNETQFDTDIADTNTENVIKDLNQPSTSYALEQDEEMEVEDSLGLLAESSRVMDDDEDQDQEDEDDGSPDDDDGDFDPDEERNIATVDHSEDSSTHQSESEVAKDQQGYMETAEGTKVDEIDIVINEVETGKEAMDVDFNELAAESQDMTLNDVDADTEITIEEAPIKTSLAEQNENTTSTDNTLDTETIKLSDESNDHRESKCDDLPAGVQEREDGTTPTSTLNAETVKLSPSNAKKLCIAKPQQVVNIVDLEETSSEEDEPNRPVEPSSSEPTESNDNVTSLHIPMEIEIMSTSGGATSEIVTRQGEVVISGVPKPRTVPKTARLNTSEVTIKTANTNPPIIIPETKIQDKTLTDKPMEQSLEVFNVDSDEEENRMQDVTEEVTKKAKESWKCINSDCKSSVTEFQVADSTAVLFFDASRKKRRMVCFECADMVEIKKRALMEDFMGMKPLLDLDPGKLSQELVEISDSDSDEEGADDLSVEKLGLESGKFLEDNLMDMLNETWAKYDMDKRLQESHDALQADMERVEQECKNIDAMLRQCQVDTDKLRNDFYATFEPKRKQLQPIVIFDTPLTKYTNPEYQECRVYNTLNNDIASKKTNSSTENSSETPTQDQKKQKENKEEDDNMEVSVVELSKEAAPADLPAPGELFRPPLKSGEAVYARRTAFGSWMPAHILDVQHTSDDEFTSCRVKFDGAKNATKTLLARYIAYNTPADVRMTIGTRLIALFKDPNSAVKCKVYYSGVVAEMPNPVNNYRYLVFFDDGYAQYVSHRDTRLVCECSLHVWDEVHPFSRQFVRDYLLAYPERPMVRLHKGQNIKTEWNGKWWISRVLSVDASLVQVYFEVDNRTEWIYRGSTRLAPLFLELQAAERHRNRPMPRSNKAQPRSNMPYVEYTRPDEQKPNDTQTPQQNNEEIRRQRAVAKKSTGGPQPTPAPPIGVQEAVTSRVVYYSPKNAVKPHDMVPHTCGPNCKRTDVLTLRELRTYNPLTKPLLSGWERQIVKYKNNREVMYRAPCGRRIRNMPELHRYLRATCSDMPVDLFDFEPSTHCLAEFVLNRCRVSKKDLSHGKENVPVPCVNYYSDTLPDFCSYNTERTPTAGVPLNLDPEFLCGCDCTDDCQDKTKCACWKMTLEGARTINLTGPNVGYVYKRLPEPLPTGIYECNSRCKCKHTCLNRVAQFPLQLKLQVFKTSNRGWGIRALNDVPKGAFLCVYAGNLLTDATANLDGLNEGDEYLAELDYIEVVEQMKEGYEEDIPDGDKELDRIDGKKEESEEEELSSSEEETASATADKDDDDFRPAYDVEYSAMFKKTLRIRERRNKNKKDHDSDEKEEKDKDKGGKEDANCITISDDEEAIREPSRFAAESSMSGNEFVSKFRSLRSYFGKDEACYIMDAKVQGNIGRYLNHSCCPNVFVQNVFVDTHDPRFPWVAFFALSYIKAGTELTWNYNYDVGSVPGKILYCLCRAPNCRGRLL